MIYYTLPISFKKSDIKYTNIKKISVKIIIICFKNEFIICYL